MVCECLKKSNDALTKGLRVYHSVGSSLLRNFSDTNLAPRERANLAWKPVIFLRIWKTWVLYEKYNPNTHFISDQTYTDTILAGHSVILNMLVFAKNFPDVPFCPWFWVRILAKFSFLIFVDLQKEKIILTSWKC